VVEVAAGRLESYPGDYDAYRAAAAARGGAAGPPASPAGPAPRPPAGPPAGRPAGSTRRARPDPAARARQRALETLEGRIHALEARLRELETALGDPALYADGARARAVTAERKSAEVEVAGLLREWEELATEAAARE
jgi:ATP-binding cassette subfamily F protein 3